MPRSHLKVTDGELAGSWIAPRLGGEFGAVTCHVPMGYEAYARIFHPASDSTGKAVSWADVAHAMGTTVHRQMQWHAILGLADPRELQVFFEPDSLVGAKWSGYGPTTGSMDPDILGSLFHILAAYIGDLDKSYFGLCTIQNWLEAFQSQDMKPLLRLPNDREYVVLTGALSSIDQISRPASGCRDGVTVAGQERDSAPEKTLSYGTLHKAPNLIWPEDHAWFVVSEVDFDSTLVGGSANLIEDIIGASDLEAWRVEPTDSLTVDADEVNL